MYHIHKTVFLLIALLCAPQMLFAQASVRSVFNRIDFASSDNATLHGYFSPGATVNAVTQNTETQKPTVLALHGCGGMLNAKSAPNARTEAYAKLFNAQGWNVLFLDSFTGRGVQSICGGGQAVMLAQRVADVQAVVGRLSSTVSAIAGVDARRLAVIGWSHGGSTALSANGKNVAYTVQPLATVVFYPGCGARSVQRQWQPAAPVLMQLGAADDWTDPKPCQTLAADWPTLIAVDTYANAYHGFDSNAPLTQLKSITSSMTGQGVHLGGEPAAKAASEARVLAYLAAAFK